MKHPLIFVMGVQRSGTNALFRSLRGGATSAYNESNDNAVFDAMFLRPEPEVRAEIADARGPVLIKPISETKRRSVVDVFQAYSAHNLRLVWVYRDPVNCYASHIARWDEFRDQPDGFVKSWCSRNQKVLDALAVFGDRVAVVRYADLIDDPQVVKSLGTFLGLRGRYRFRKDSNRGRRVLNKKTVERIIEGSRLVWDDLERSRRFEAEQSSFWRQSIGRIT